jgi:hypothetical protein
MLLVCFLVLTVILEVIATYIGVFCDVRTKYVQKQATTHSISLTAYTGNSVSPRGPNIPARVILERLGDSLWSAPQNIYL